VQPGTYRIRFQTGAYFAAHKTQGFFPLVEIQFTVVDGAQHYHVPLLLSPFGFSTYRGS
jgi:5-hydroxyisourate hydrolase